MRLWRLARYMRGFDLVLTYNWGAFDAVMAKRLFALARRSSTTRTASTRTRPRRSTASRNLYRRLGLGAAYRLVVPSERLERIARKAWATPAVRIPNGSPGRALPQGPRGRDAIPGFERRPGEVVIGTVAGLRAVKNLPRLVRAFAAHDATRRRGW